MKADIQAVCERVNAAVSHHKDLVVAAGGAAKLAALSRRHTFHKTTVFQSPIAAWVRWACNEIGKDWRARHAAEEASNAPREA